MIGFFVKKAFFDGWDHLFALAAMNIPAIVIVLCLFALPLSLGAGGPVIAVCAAAGLLLLGISQSVCAFALNAAADYRQVSFRETLAGMRKALVPGLQAGALAIAVFFSVFVGIPFYFSQKNILMTFAGGLLFWFCLIALLAGQYYLPLEARLGGGFRKNAKKAFILLADNLGFSFFLLLYNACSLALSVFTAFLAPGFSGIALAGLDAVKLRLMKYDWLEGKPEADRRKVPWDELLEEEKELVGKRTLKGMIFPWKESK